MSQFNQPKQIHQQSHLKVTKRMRKSPNRELMKVPNPTKIHSSPQLNLIPSIKSRLIHLISKLMICKQTPFLLDPNSQIKRSKNGTWQ